MDFLVIFKQLETADYSVSGIRTGRKWKGVLRNFGSVVFGQTKTFIFASWLILYWTKYKYVSRHLLGFFTELANQTLQIIFTSFPLVSPFSNHSTVTLSVASLSPLIQAECTRPVDKKRNACYKQLCRYQCCIWLLQFTIYMYEKGGYSC